MTEYLFPQDIQHKAKGPASEPVVRREGGMTQRAYIATQLLAAHVVFLAGRFEYVTAPVSHNVDIEDCINLADMLIQRLEETQEEGGDK